MYNLKIVLIVCYYLLIISEIEFDQTILDENQITKLLNEHNETVDKEYEQSEVIVNHVELQNLSENSIFTGKFLLK